MLLARFRFGNCIAIRKKSRLFWRARDSTYDWTVPILSILGILALSVRQISRKMDFILISVVSRCRRAISKICLTDFCTY